MGAPNAGKSTLVNALTGRKVSGVSAKPQTTRRRILGVRSEPGCQMIFVDTPGFGPAGSELGDRMNKAVAGAAREADVIVGVADARKPDDLAVAAGLARGRKAPALLALNKVDLVPKPSLLPVLERLAGEGLWAEVVPLAALQDDGVELLRGLIRARLPEGPRWYEESPAVPAPEPAFLQEIVQEALFGRLKQEVPYGCAVHVESVEEDGALLRVTAAILAERESHKPILVGAGGAMIKAVGTAARLELEKLLGRKVFLGLRVKVEADWRNRPGILADLGYAADETPDAPDGPEPPGESVL